MKHHWLWMVIGCGLPFLLIFLAPAIGIGSDIWLFTFILLLFALHLLMPMKHGKHTHGLSEENPGVKERKDLPKEHRHTSSAMKSKQQSFEKDHVVKKEVKS